MNVTQTVTHIEQGALDARLCALYGKSALAAQRQRYLTALRAFAERFGEREVCVFSVPGRSELSGNHTDHNHGCVIATAVDADIIAVAAAREDDTVTLLSEGFPEDVVTLSRFNAPNEARFGRSDALIAGVCASLAARGYRVGGFDAYTTSSVPKGSGLSSSAAFENMVGCIENHLYNGGNIGGVTLAQVSKRAENLFFGKPCGLMDQLASAIGGAISIDFADPTAPTIRQNVLDLAAAGYTLCIVNTGGNHADLTPDYAAIPAEMKAVAKALGNEVLREVDEAQFYRELPTLRAQLGDRAVLRAIHFFAENRRVKAQQNALENGDLAAFLANVSASGRSSFCYLQNVYSPTHPGEQGVSLALALAEEFLTPVGGACRVHGGGFAGTIQAFVPSAQLAAFCEKMDGVFGKGATSPLRMRAEGAVRLL